MRLSVLMNLTLLRNLSYTGRLEQAGETFKFAAFSLLLCKAVASGGTGHKTGK
jgi:hypothetical protein